MCGLSSGKIRGVIVDIEIGSYGGKIEVYEFKYGVGEYEDGSRSEFINFFKKFKKIEILELLADIVENADEG